MCSFAIASREYRSSGCVIPGSTQRLKIRAPADSQRVGREKLFERDRDGDPDLYYSVAMQQPAPPNFNVALFTLAAPLERARLDV